MSFRLIDSGWEKLLGGAASRHASLQIISPFIKTGALTRMLDRGRPKEIKVITRFNLMDFYEGVNDLSALRLLLQRGAEIRGVKGLHTKLYIFGGREAVLTSANLTGRAFNRNQEFGFLSDDAPILAACSEYFESLWARSGTNLTMEWLEKMAARVTLAQTSAGKATTVSGLGDEGTPVPQPPAEITTISVGRSKGPRPAGFVKFFGEAHHRADRNMPVIQEVRSSESHWACTYPNGKRPRQVEDGDILFMARLVDDPADIQIYGRAKGLKHVPGRDDASPEDIARCSWKEDWPHYIRVYGAEFLAGTLQTGISMNRMMEELGSDAFSSTQRHARDQVGNTNPRRAYLQKAAVALTQEGVDWLQHEFEIALRQNGSIPPADLESLYWPEVPSEALIPASKVVRQENSKKGN